MRATLLIALALAGCTTAKTMMLDDRTALISGRDSGWGSGSDVARKVLIAAAQMARARGYEVFRIVSTQDTTKSGYVPIAGTAATNTHGSAYCYGSYCSGSATTQSTGIPAYLAPYTQAGADVVVRFYHADEIQYGTPGTYNVAAILSSQK